jgi:hypothetical protein
MGSRLWIMVFPTNPSAFGSEGFLVIINLPDAAKSKEVSWTPGQGRDGLLVFFAPK